MTEYKTLCWKVLGKNNKLMSRKRLRKQNADIELAIKEKQMVYKQWLQERMDESENIPVYT